VPIGVLGEVRFVYLVRDDPVAQAVSWARAEQTQFWQVGDHALAGVEPRFDFDLVDGLLHTIQAHNAAWQNWFETFEVQPHLVHYEQLVRDPSGCTRRILEFLGLELASGRAISSDRQRQADQLNADWISRYHDVRRRRARPKASTDAEPRRQ
jgi:LPS sulfotransferase NodH